MYIKTEVGSKYKYNIFQCQSTLLTRLNFNNKYTYHQTFLENLSIMNGYNIIPTSTEEIH